MRYEKCVCRWKIWVRLIKRKKQGSDHIRSSALKPLSCTRLFQAEEVKELSFAKECVQAVYKDGVKSELGYVITYANLYLV